MHYLSNKGRNWRGSITIYCCLCLTIWIGCVGIFLESARVRGLVSRLDRTAASALESVMADYNKIILEQYNLFLLDYGKAVKNQKEVQARWKTYFQKESDETTGNFLYSLFYDSEWFALKASDCYIDTTWTLLDQEGTLFANQAAQYMKYREVGNLVSTLIEQIKVMQKGTEGQETFNSLWKSDTEENKNVETQSTLLSPHVKNLHFLYTYNIDGMEVLEERIPATGLPSRMEGLSTEKPRSSPIWNEISEQVLIGEYILEHFATFSDQESQGKLNCQLEYILFGKLSDKENLEEVTDLLLVVRSGLNLISLISSESMQSAVQATAAVIGSGLLNPELTPLIQIILNCMWAYEEAEKDVEKLLKGEQVPFLKKEFQWVESLVSFVLPEEVEEGVSSIIDGTHIHGTQERQEANTITEELKNMGINNERFYSIEMSYKDYMRIFLLFLSPKVKYYRTMDMIQTEMQSRYPDFKLSNCICGVEAVVEVRGNPKFLVFLPQKNFLWNGRTEYEITRRVSFLY